MTVSVAADLYFPRFGDVADEVLAAFIEAQATELRLAIYSLNDPAIVQAISKQHQANVPMRLITDHLQSFGTKQLDMLKQLKAAGVPIKTNHHTGIMHLKLAVRDTQALALGSFNWTTAAESVNDEVLAVIENTTLAQQAASVFDRMWDDTSRFIDWSPPTIAELHRMMLSEPPEF